MASNIYLFFFFDFPLYIYIQNPKKKNVIDKKITYSARGFGVLTADFVNDNIGKEFNVRMEVQKWKEKKHPFMTPM